MIFVTTLSRLLFASGTRYRGVKTQTSGKTSPTSSPVTTGTVLPNTIFPNLNVMSFPRSNVNIPFASVTPDSPPQR